MLLHDRRNLALERELVVFVLGSSSLLQRNLLRMSSVLRNLNRFALLHALRFVLSHVSIGAPLLVSV